MPVLTIDDVGGKHRYLASTQPHWRRSMVGIKAEGGPWKCETCGTASFLVYRCSSCGADLATERQPTQAYQGL